MSPPEQPGKGAPQSQQGGLPSDFPDRNRESWPQESLLPLPQIGIGTRDCESLSGYLVRLAGAHVVPTRVLTARIFPAVLARLGHVSERAVHGRRGAWMNGTGLWAQAVSDAFSVLTRQPHLARLTMLPWRHVLAPRSFLAPVRRWCPDCYADMRSTHGLCWDALIWSLTPVPCCPRHRRPLATRCPECRRPQPFLSSDTALGWCALCGSDLGRVEAARCGQRVDPYDGWCADACADMVALASRGEAAASPLILKSRMLKIVEVIEGGNVSAFARRVGVTRNAVKHWLRQGTIHLDLLLLMSWCVGLKPADLFTAEDPLEYVGLGRWQRAGIGERGTRWVRRDWNAVCRRFDEIVSTTPAVRLRDVAARLGVDTALLRERFPDRVAAITSRRRSAVSPPKKAKVVPRSPAER